MKKITTMLIVSMMSVLLLSACGKESGGSSKEILRVGTNAEFPPFEYIGDDGKPEGFDIALIQAIGDKMGMEVQISDMEFDSLIIAIGSKIDVAIAGMTIDDERKESVDFSDPYYDAWQYVLVPAGSDYSSFEDLENKTIGVQLGTTGMYIAEDDIPGAEVKSYNKPIDAVNDMLNGRVDVVIIDRNPALVFEEKKEGQIVALDGSIFGFDVEDYAIAVPKGNQELLDGINKALAEIKADGTFDKIVEEYIAQ